MNYDEINTASRQELVDRVAELELKLRDSAETTLPPAENEEQALIMSRLSSWPE